MILNQIAGGGGGARIASTENPDNTQDLVITDRKDVSFDLATLTSDANATAMDIRSGKCAYVNGVKVNGIHACVSGGNSGGGGGVVISQYGVDTSDATATAADIKIGKTAYVNGEKVIGTMTGKDAVTPITVIDDAIAFIP